MLEQVTEFPNGQNLTYEVIRQGKERVHKKLILSSSVLEDYKSINSADIGLMYIINIK